MPPLHHHIIRISFTRPKSKLPSLFWNTSRQDNSPAYPSDIMGINPAAINLLLSPLLNPAILGTLRLVVPIVLFSGFIQLPKGSFEIKYLACPCRL